MLKSVYQLIAIAFKRVKLLIELKKYDNYTVAEYFRKQGVQIGENCCIYPRVLGDEPYLIKIGNHVCINTDVRLHTHDGGTWIFREEKPDLRVFGPIVIEDNCLIGEGAKILPNVTIGKNSIVGAGSVVIADVPPNSIVMGVPARRFGSVEKYKEKCIDHWKEQKPPDLHPEGNMQWERSKNVKIIREQLRKHLAYYFKDKLK